MTNCSEMERWARENGSGSLRQAIECDMAWKAMALHERTAMDLFTAGMWVQKSRLTTGQFFAEGDCRVTTELGWFRRTIVYRLKHHVLYKDAPFTVEARYFTLDEEGSSKEGAGFIVSGLSIPWAPVGKILLVPLAFFDPETKSWGPTENPL